MFGTSRILAVLAAICLISLPASGATVASGRDHSLAVTLDGSVWAWGQNTRGQLGTGHPVSTDRPEQIISLSQISAVAAGDGFSIALDADGAVWSWGANDAGQLGDGTTTDQRHPARVSGLPGIVAVSAAGTHVLALDEESRVWTWGNGNPFPSRVDDLPHLRRIAAGVGSDLGVTREGMVWRWTEKSTAALDDLGNVSAITATSEGKIIGVSDGSVLVGSNDGKGSSDRIELAVAARSAEIHGDLVLTVGTDGSVWVWRLADGAPTIPERVETLGNIVAIVSGSAEVLALERGGRLWSWSGPGTGTRPVDLPVVWWRVATPEFNPLPGDPPAVLWHTYIETFNRDAEIHVTTDGRTPTLADPIVGRDERIVIGDTVELRARGWAEDLEPSEVGSARYEIPETDSGGGAIDGGAPSNRPVDLKNLAGHLYSNGFEEWELPGWSSTHPPPAVMLDSPLLSPGGGTYTEAQAVDVTCPPLAMVSRYSTTGTPTAADPLLPCGGTLEVAASTTIRTRAWAWNYLPSPMTEDTYLFQYGEAETPVFNPTGGTYQDAQSVAITSATAGATIRYTTDGVDPTFVSPIYEGPVAVSSTGVLKARAFRRDHSPSAVASATYLIGNAAGAPVLSPGSGVYHSKLTVTVSNTVPWATIRYTTDGTDPGLEDEVIADGGTIEVDRSLRIKARAWADGFDPSAITTADYEITGAVSGGATHTMALRHDGIVWAWGENQTGEIGTGDDMVNEYRVPQQVVDLTDVVAIDAGSRHSMAVKADGTVWSWGWGFRYRNGDGTGTDRFAPVQVLTETGVLENITVVSGGRAHSLAIANDRTVWGWGENLNGQLGITQDISTSPVAVPVQGLTGIAGVSAGSKHSLVLKTDGEATGSLWAFGQNANGELGDGTTDERRQPVKIMDGVRSICAGGHHSMVVLADGTLLGAGLNDRGQLGTGNTDGPILTFQPVFGGAGDIEGCSASGVHSFALRTDRTVIGTGHNDHGQVGDGTKENRNTPIEVVLLKDVVQAEAGMRTGDVFSGWYAHSVATTSDGRVWCWGSNNRGQLGNGWGHQDSRFRPDVVRNFNLTDRSWPDGDPDGDGLTNEQELELGTDPYNPDSNGDGIDDLTASRSGLDPLNPDMDGDGIDNSTERAQNTDPLRADTDEDGVPDGADCFPLDPARSECPPPVPGDTEPPVITLIEPTNAVLISSIP